MATDLRLIVETAQTHPHKLSTHRLCDGATERGLADARRADEADDRSLDRCIECTDGEMFEDPIFDLIEAVVILIEDCRRLFEIELIGGRARPGEGDECFDIVAGQTLLRAHRWDTTESLEFALRLLADRIGHSRRFDLLLEFVCLECTRILFAELALDRLKLFAEDELALSTIDL